VAADIGSGAGWALRRGCGSFFAALRRPAARNSYDVFCTVLTVPPCTLHPADPEPFGPVPDRTALRWIRLPSVPRCLGASVRLHHARSVTSDPSDSSDAGAPEYQGRSCSRAWATASAIHKSAAPPELHDVFHIPTPQAGLRGAKLGRRRLRVLGRYARRRAL